MDNKFLKRFALISVFDSVVNRGNGRRFGDNFMTAYMWCTIDRLCSKEYRQQYRAKERKKKIATSKERLARKAKEEQQRLDDFQKMKEFALMETNNPFIKIAQFCLMLFAGIIYIGVYSVFKLYSLFRKKAD